MEESKPNCTFTFKKRSRGRGGMSSMSRQRKKSSSSSSGEEESAVVRSDKRKHMNPMIQKSGNFKKFKGKGGGGGGGGDSSSDEDQSNLKKSTQLLYQSTGEKVDKSDQNATATRNIDTEESMDQRAINERAEEVMAGTKGKEDDKVYRGLNNYNQYIEKKESLIGKRLTIKPIRAPTNIRSTVRWDYEPMICKDFKETGYCGFGDTCKFMHDRSDYKHGWQMDKEFEAGEYVESDEEKYVISDDDEFPKKCGICRKNFQNPVVTRCKHYFCERCALDHYRKSQRCALCGQQTGGMFNPAKDLMERMAKWAAEGREFESEESDDDERLPDESKPSIPEDDPDYYSKVHDPHS